MRRKMTATVFLTMLLAGTLASMHKAEVVWASGTIYIKADGSVEGTDKIQRDGDVYTFKDNINEPIVVQRDNVIVDGNGYTLQSTGSGTGFDLSNRKNVTIKKTHISEWYYGILGNASSGNTIESSNFTKNVQRAIFLSNSSDNIIRNNFIINNTRGIFLWQTNTTTVTGNNISNNSKDGVSIVYSSLYNTIAENTVSNNSYAGISLYPICTGNTIIGNNITSNAWGIYIETSNANTFYHNNLLYNTVQLVSYVATNTWDDGYPSGGNYWSDHPKVDSYWGPYQDKTGSDGIIDAKYLIDDYNRDNCPLMSPYYYWSNPILGDINKDMKVDNKDLSQLAIAYGSTPEKPNWNPNSDINSDNMVSVSDLFRLGKNFGKPADNTSP